MKADLITPERINELTRFLPLFDKPDRQFIVGWAGGTEKSGGPSTGSYPLYPPDVEAFFRLASQPWWCDYQYQPVQAGAMLEDDEVIQSASIEQIKTMLTFCVRGERFCYGHWEAVLKSGRILALLRRLEVLQAELSNQVS